MGRSFMTVWAGVLLLCWPAGDARLEAQDRRAVVVRDSGGVVIVENGRGEDAAVCAIDPEPTLRIGSAMSAPEYQLHRVFDAATLSDGRIAVANQGSHEVRIYGPDGEFLRALGRAGGGPGEFRRVYRAWIGAGDTIIVGDFSPWRLSYFTSDGVFVRSVEPTPRISFNPEDEGMFFDGSFMFAETCCRTGDPAFTPRRITARRYAGDGEQLNPLGSYPYGSLGTLEPAEARLAAGALFESVTHLAVAGDLLVVAPGGSPEFTLSNPDGSVAKLVRWRGDPLPVRSGDVAAYRRATIARASTPEARRSAEALASPTRPVSRTLPVYTRVRGSLEGDVWLRLFEPPGIAPSQEWLVFDAEGRLRCRATMPAEVGSFGIFEIGRNQILAKVSDELGVEQVVRFPVRGPVE